ncbi:hypothetical protein [Micromonospora sp. HUAS LYJ1]|uniref:hypothetical protein n=1 Tax=Micromonospora sp. HUAS LYJ1 TaxID=3061626 RepID=UPI0026730F26|nr:hypothetical protein [Micromonospora sp. HUAS LYJ1]WKU03520.1 hypothetical protein Q2K16_22065 [Micromonospora sp. HUAS LYJ1]
MGEPDSKSLFFSPATYSGTVWVGKKRSYAAALACSITESGDVVEFRKEQAGVNKYVN